MAKWTPQLRFGKRFWVGCAVMLLGLSFLVAALMQSRDVRALARDGVPVPATVIDTRKVATTNGDSDDWIFHLSNSFAGIGAGNNQSITNERRVPEPFFKSHPTGTSWTIRAHPDDPTLHDLYPNETKRNTWGLLIVSAFLTAIGTFFALSRGTLAAIRARA